MTREVFAQIQDFEPKSRPLFKKDPTVSDDIVWLTKPTVDDLTFISLTESDIRESDNNMYSYYAVRKVGTHLYDGITHCNGVLAPEMSLDASCPTLLDDSGNTVDDIGEFYIFFDIDFVNVNEPILCPYDFDSIDLSFKTGNQGTFIKNPYTDLIYKCERVDIYTGETFSLHLQSNPNFFKKNEYIDDNDAERNIWKFPHTTLKAPRTLESSESISTTNNPPDDSEVIIEISNDEGTGCFKTMRTNLITSVNIIAKEMNKIGKDFTPKNNILYESKDLGENPGSKFPSLGDTVKLFKSKASELPIDYKNLDYFAYIRAFCLDNNVSLLGSTGSDDDVLKDTRNLLISRQLYSLKDTNDVTYSAYPLYHK